MAKTAQELLNQNNVNKGITTWLDSSATEKPQPSGMFNADSNRIPGADPKTPSTNPATRREQYNIGTSDVPESTKIGGYDTVAGSMPKTYYPKTQETTEDYLWAIKNLPGFSYYTTDFDNQLKEVEQYLREQGIDATKEMYWSTMADAASQLATLNMQLWQLKAQENQITNTQAINAKLVYTLAKEVWSGLAQWQSVQQIAKQLWQDERVIQKIANNQTEELVQLNADYEEEQLRQYLRNREDLDIDIARNIAQYNNIQRNLDYQFDSAMQTLERDMFDAKRAAKETSGIFGMTGTEYTLNRIKAQYDQQIWDVKNTYNYQSANAQMAINNALEDYSKNLQRRAQDYAQARKGLQGYALQMLMNIENNIWLTADQMEAALTTAYKNIAAAQSSAMTDYLKALDSGNTKLSTEIANAYGLNVSGVGKMRTERNNNPTAMITAKAKQLWWVLWVDYEIWDSFTGSDWRTYYTARLIWDPIETTIRLLDRWLEKWLSNIFSGRTYASKLWLNNEVRRNATPEEKKEIVYKMLAEEGGNMDLMRYYAEQNSAAEGTSTAEAEYDAEVNDTDNILTTLKSELEAVDFSKDLKKTLKESGERDHIKSLDAREAYLKWWIKTLWALFAQATDPDAKYHAEALTIISWAPNALWDLGSAVTDFSRIYNKNFIEYLIQSKGQWATFWNLTEWEWFKILTAANEMSSWMSQTELLKRINNALDLMDWRRKTTEQNVTPQENMSMQDVIDRLNSLVWAGSTVWTGAETWIVIKEFF